MPQNRIPLKSFHYSPQGKRTIGRKKNDGESNCNSGDGMGLNGPTLDVYDDDDICFCARAPSGPWPPHYHGFVITFRHATFGRIPLNESSTHRRDLYLTTCTSQKQREFHAPSRIQTGYPSNQAAADPCLRLHGNWNQPQFIHLTKNYVLDIIMQMICTRRDTEGRL
jgi:hypothetical protein